MAVLIKQAQGKKVEATEQGKLTKAHIYISSQKLAEFNITSDKSAMLLQNLCKMVPGKITAVNLHLIVQVLFSFFLEFISAGLLISI